VPLFSSLAMQGPVTETDTLEVPSTNLSSELSVVTARKVFPELAPREPPNAGKTRGTATTPGSPVVKAPAVLRQLRRTSVCRCPLRRIFRCSALPLTTGRREYVGKPRYKPAACRTMIACLDATLSTPPLALHVDELIRTMAARARSGPGTGASPNRLACPCREHSGKGDGYLGGSLSPTAERAKTTHCHRSLHLP